MTDLSFTVLGVRPQPNGAAPTLDFRVRIQTSAGQAVHAVLLRCLIQIEPRRRRHEPSEQERMTDLFGEPERWRDTLKPLVWARASISVPAFTGSIEIDVPVACTYDFEVAAAKYLDALEGGEVPLTFLFSGTVFAKAENGFRVEQVAWDKESAYRMPVQAWRDLMDAYFPGCAWIRVRRESLDAFERYRARHGFLSWDDTIEALVGKGSRRAMSFEIARKIADAVLYEGYVLYPYRRSAAKNQFRWQFGIVAPRAWSEQGGDPWEMQTECLIEPQGSPTLALTVRFLQVRVRDAGRPEEWEEGVERTIDLENIRLDDLVAGRRDVPFGVPGEQPLGGRIRLSAERIDGFVKLRVRIENLTDFPEADKAGRSAAMRRSLVGTHTLLAVSGGAFVSLMDPPAEALAAASSCSNLRTWPVLAGPTGARDVLLSSPIILEDYPAIAPESQGDFYDATEVDELMTLRVMTLTDDEKREACATDDRARHIIERCDSTPPEVLERLHGAIRPLEPKHIEHFFNPPGEQPESAVASVAGGRIARGARVRLMPKRMADSMDLFLAGRTAIVEGVHHDVENKVYVAVRVEDDPAADIQGRVGRFFYFHPDELEFVEKES